MPNHRTDADLLKHNFYRNLKHIKPIEPVHKIQKEQTFEPTLGAVFTDEPIWELQLNGKTVDCSNTKVAIIAHMNQHEYSCYKPFIVLNGIKKELPYKPKRRIAKNNCFQAAKGIKLS